VGHSDSESVLGKFLLNGSDLLVAEGLLASVSLLGLVLMVPLRLCESLGLERSHDAGSVPALRGGEFSKHAELSGGLHAEHLECLWSHHSSLLVVWIWDALEDLESQQSSGTAWRLVWGHASHDLPEDAGWLAEVVVVLSWVRVASLVQVLSPLELVSEQRSRDVDLFASDDHNLLTVQDVLSDNRGKSAEQVAFSVYDNLLFEHA